MYKISDKVYRRYPKDSLTIGTVVSIHEASEWLPGTKLHVSWAVPGYHPVRSYIKPVGLVPVTDEETAARRKLCHEARERWRAAHPMVAYCDKCVLDLQQSQVRDGHCVYCHSSVAPIQAGR